MGFGRKSIPHRAILPVTETLVCPSGTPDAVLGEAEARSPLAKRPYDLRHTCVSTWLNTGVSETLVAQWAGRSLAVLKKLNAKCLVGEAGRPKRQIEEALRRS